MPQIPPIPAEQLVPAVAAERYGHVLARVPAHQRRGQQRAVGKRFAKMAQHRLDGGQDILESEPELVVLGMEVLCDQAGVARLVVARMVGIADGERLDGRLGPARQGGDDDGRVQPAGQKRADRHIGDTLPLDGRFNPHAQLTDRCLIRHGHPGRISQAMETPRLLGPGRIEIESVTRRELADLPVDRPRVRDEPEVQIAAQRIAIDFRRQIGDTAQRPQLASEDQSAGHIRVEQRLDPERVARQVPGPLTRVHDRHRPHGIEPLEGRWPPGHAGLEGDFGIGGRPMRAGQLLAQLAIVVQLTVVADGPSPARIGHGLASPRGRVDHRQPGVGEPDRDPVRAVCPESGIVRASVRQRRLETHERLAFDRPAPEVDDARNTTHSILIVPMPA